MEPFDFAVGREMGFPSHLKSASTAPEAVATVQADEATATATGDGPGKVARRTIVPDHRKSVVCDI